MLRRLSTTLAIVAGAACCPAAASATPVLVLGPAGHVAVHQDPFLPATELDPGTPLSARPTSSVRGRSAAVRTVSSELARLGRIHAITPAAYRRYRASLQAALSAQRGLGGTRAAELQGVLSNLHEIAAAGLLTPSRLPALFLTLDRNRQWWTTGQLISSGTRVGFAGSEIVWEYYPSQGLELQELGSFGKANGFYLGGRSLYPRLRHLLREMIPLAAQRAGGLAWEYYFNFDGGTPPWTSAMSQATALQALTRGYLALHDRALLNVARHGLSIFHASPPLGVRVRTARGSRYLLYSFAPGAPVINGFLQTLVGLYDFARYSGSADAKRLFAAGDAEARAEVPSYDTGAWSLYQPGEEDTLSYHQLVTGFLQNLCTRTHARVYCTTARHFESYLKTPPALKLLTHRTRRGLGTTLYFRLSKESHVGVVMLRAGQIVFQTSAYFTYGVNSFALPPPGHTGSYEIKLGATDLAGNFKQLVGTLQVN
jgi:hypothetical protein